VVYAPLNGCCACTLGFAPCTRRALFPHLSSVNTRPSLFSSSLFLLLLPQYAEVFRANPDLDPRQKRVGLVPLQDLGIPLIRDISMEDERAAP
jgi:hypothetical protein